MRQVVMLLTLSLVTGSLLAGCAAHPVGPARTYASYEAKARTTARSARSAVATTRLLAEAAADGDVWGTFASVTVSEQEDALSGVQGTFASIQPPDDRSEQLRDELDQLLSGALAHVTAVRIEIRRGQLDGLDAHLPALRSDEQDLAAFLLAHGGDEAEA